MVKRGKRFFILNMFLALFVLVFLVLSLVNIFSTEKNQSPVLEFIPLFLGLIGVVLLVIIKETKSSYQLFMGLMICELSVFSFLLSKSILPGNILELWPVVGCLGGINLFISGYYKYKRFTFGFIIPAIILLVLSGWFFLFSFKIVTIPFKTFIIVFGPLLFVMMCVFLFVIYLLQKNKKNSEEPDTFQDDEIVQI